MKRSEAIFQIQEWLVKNYRFGFTINAENLLTHLERIGLQPPDYVKETENSAGKWRERVYCQWEPEEEGK